MDDLIKLILLLFFVFVVILILDSFLNWISFKKAKKNLDRDMVNIKKICSLNKEVEKAEKIIEQLNLRLDELNNSKSEVMEYRIYLDKGQLNAMIDYEEKVVSLLKEEIKKNMM